MRTSDALPRDNRAPWTTASQWLRARAWPWPLGVVALTVLGPLLWLPSLDMPLDPDVGVYATVAYWWAHGDVLYQRLTTDRSQGIFVVFRLIEAARLGSVRGIHFAGALVAAACALVLLAITRQLWGRGVGMLAALLFTLVMATPYLQGPTANSELFMLVPLLGSIWLLLRADEHPLTGRTGLLLLAACGVVGGLASLLKPSGVAALLLAAAWLFRRRLRERAPWGGWLRAEAILAGGFLLSWVPALAHGLLTVPDRYLEAVFLYRFTKYSVVTNSYSYQLRHFGVTSLFILLRFPILTAAAVGLWATRREQTGRQRDLLWLWILTSLAGASLGGNWWPHYFQQVLPPFAVATAFGLWALLGGRARPTRGARQLWVGLRVLAILATFGLIWTTGALLVSSRDSRGLEFDQHLPEGAVASIATYLREHTAPGDSVYVVYGQGDIYYLTQRRPAARWLHWNELANIEGAFDEQLALLSNPATAPRYVAVTHPYDAFGLDPDGQLRAIIARDYILEATIVGFPIYRRNE